MLPEKALLVTPRVGVWIETVIPTEQIEGHPSLPVWECGLKRLCQRHRETPSLVTPRVGVWIETKDELISYLDENVTPRVGVWIET